METNRGKKEKLIKRKKKKPCKVKENLDWDGATESGELQSEVSREH